MSMASTEQQACPLCGHVEHQALFDEAGHTLVACNQCDLLYISPYPQSTDQVYETVSDYHYEDLEILPAERHYRSSCNRYRWLYPRIRPYCENASSVLDVGCGTGRLLELLGEFPNLERIGLELNTKRAEFARTKANCEILSVPLQVFERKDFQVMTLMDLFSHVPDIRSFFQAVHQHLAGGGYAIIKVGEFARHTKRSAVFDWEIPDHLQFVGLRTMQYIADTIGFNIVAHERTALADEIFSKVTMQSPGRSGWRNMIKKTLAHTPGALTLLKAAHNAYTKRAAFSSFIVLQKK